MNIQVLSVFISTLLAVLPLVAIDNPHFYRANFFWGEPRLEKPSLSTYEVNFAGGTTKTAFNDEGKKVPLLNIFGFQNMRVLGENIPTLDPTNPLDEILLELLEIPARENFGELEYFGRFSIFETTINYYQNATNGFFFQAYLPVRYLRIGDISFADQSPTDDIFPNSTTPEWVAFLENFSAILTRYNLSTKTQSRAGPGDFSILAGWACNYEETEYIDYIDVDAKIGVLFPTAKKRNENEVFSLPLGYNGHFGVPLKFDCSFGYWDWLTLGLHIGALFLIEKNRVIRMQTSTEQNGFFDLLKGKAKVDPGTIWEISPYVKADHFAKGFSLLFGYCYTQKDRDCIQPNNTTLFNPIAVNADQRFRSWNMHVLHFMAEYDFAKKATDVLPRIGFFYNYIVSGKRIFDTSIVSAYGVLDCSWEF